MSADLSNSKMIRQIASNNYEELYEALAELSLTQIEVIQMRFWEELTIDQIASVICMTWDEANALIEKTLDELRNLVEKKMNKMPMPQAA
jgi:DNA-directed RNA polymerase specialized sigma24 family protein